MFYGKTNANGESQRVCVSVAKYLDEYPSATEKCKAIFKTAEELIETYRKILTPADISEARMLCWGRQSVEEYVRMFRYRVLMNYRVWEISAEKFYRLYSTIKKENPEWSKIFMMDYENKLRRCKVAIKKIAV